MKGAVARTGGFVRQPKRARSLQKCGCAAFRHVTPQKEKNKLHGFDVAFHGCLATTVLLCRHATALRGFVENKINKKEEFKKYDVLPGFR